MTNLEKMLQNMTDSTESLLIKVKRQTIQVAKQAKDMRLFTKQIQLMNI